MTCWWRAWCRWTRCREAPSGRTRARRRWSAPERTFTIGMPMQVKVVSTDEVLGRIEFSLVP